MSTETNILLCHEKARQYIDTVNSRKKRSTIGQFLTPAPIARYMASLFEEFHENVMILDAGAGSGILFTALVEELCARYPLPASIGIVAYENDEKLKPLIEKALDICGKKCQESGISFEGSLNTEDFISSAILELDNGLFGKHGKRFTHAILNPPYKKIHSSTNTRKYLSLSGLETTNLYAAFVWLSVRLLEPGGEVVAITPRSFCNGPYFKSYRKSLLDLIGIRRIHVFESRKEAFADDSVLQENIIFQGKRGGEQSSHIGISISKGSDFKHSHNELVSFRRVVSPSDEDVFIHLVEDEESKRIMDRMCVFETALHELGIEVSTGRVVDFRARDFLRKNPEQNTVPLIYPSHFDNGFVRWPVLNGKKPNAILYSEDTKDLLVKSGYYVLTKRFSSKEEKRRIVAAILNPNHIDAEMIGFENHLNYFHANGDSMPEELCNGLAVFLNSTLFDRYFRLFSGHTQVNATDLRKVHYPSLKQLINMGRKIGGVMPEQEIIDQILTGECGHEKQ